MDLENQNPKQTLRFYSEMCLWERFPQESKPLDTPTPISVIVPSVVS